MVECFASPVKDSAVAAAVDVALVLHSPRCMEHSRPGEPLMEVAGAAVAAVAPEDAPSLPLPAHALFLARCRSVGLCCSRKRA